MGIPNGLKAFGIAKALDYLDRDPDANLPRLMEWVDRYAGAHLPLAYQDLFHRAMTDPDNNWHQLIRSMYTDIDTHILKKIFENFIIHSGLLDWPNRCPSGQAGGDKAPWAVILPPSFPCSMDCAGCGASIYGVRPSMEFDSLDQELEGRKARGCHLFIFNGGDPLAEQERIIALCNKHSDCVFAVFTPPQAITPSLCQDLLRVGNLFPAIRMDEAEPLVVQAAGLLRAARLPFGVACRCTVDNADQMATETQYDQIIALGAKFCGFFSCPAYPRAAPALPHQLTPIHQRVVQFRKTKPLLTLDFWDGPSPSAAPQGGIPV